MTRYTMTEVSFGVSFTDGYLEETAEHRAVWPWQVASMLRAGWSVENQRWLRVGMKRRFDAQLRAKTNAEEPTGDQPYLSESVRDALNNGSS